jgi:hypothetical protein
MIEKSKREEIVELAVKLFVFTDEQNWDGLSKEVFTETVVFDMSSLGGNGAEKTSSSSIIENWKKSFEGLDAIFHQSGNYLVNIRDEGHAELSCSCIAVHYNKSATKGTTREFYGNYDIVCVLTDIGWRINGLRYKVKFVSGNSNFK